MVMTNPVGPAIGSPYMCEALSSPAGVRGVGVDESLAIRYNRWSSPEAENCSDVLDVAPGERPVLHDATARATTQARSHRVARRRRDASQARGDHPVAWRSSSHHVSSPDDVETSPGSRDRPHHAPHQRQRWVRTTVRTATPSSGDLSTASRWSLTQARQPIGSVAISN